MYSNFNIENDTQAMTSQLNTPAYQQASTTALLTGTSTDWVFYGGNDFGISLPVVNDNNSNPFLTFIAMGFMYGAYFQEAASDVGFGGGGNVPLNAGGETEVHGNSLLTTKDCFGYALKDRTTDEILKYGDTLYPDTRYTAKYLDSIQAYMDVEAWGNKAEMHYWQHDQIVDYLNSCGQLPPYNNGEW